MRASCADTDAPCGSTVELSASDLSQFLGCRHRTALDLAAARGLREAPVWVDPVMVVLQQRGLDNERRYTDALRAEGLIAVDLADLGGDDSVARMAKAFRAVDVVLQGAFRQDPWFGRPDVLSRVGVPSALAGHIRSSTPSSIRHPDFVLLSVSTLSLEPRPSPD